jgi:hypothetical protein
MPAAGGAGDAGHEVGEDPRIRIARGVSGVRDVRPRLPVLD